MFRLNTEENIVSATKKMIDMLLVQVTITSLKKALQEHPDYPSLLSISDTLTSCGIENLSLKTTAKNLLQLPPPFIVQINKPQGKMFTVISRISQQNISWYDETAGKTISSPIAEFEKIFTGFVLLASPSEGAGEKDYLKKRKEEVRSAAKKAVSLLIIPFISLVAAGLSLSRDVATAMLPVASILLSLAGSIITGFLITYETRSQPGGSRQTCGTGKRVNCDAILTSRAAKIAGISWSTIGFTYFSGGMLTLLFAGITGAIGLFVTSWLNILALPYILFSIYYQWKVAQQWCTYCLSVQALLAIQFVVNILGGWMLPVTEIPVAMVIVIFTAYALPFAMINFLLPIQLAARERGQQSLDLQRFRNNRNIFETLLERQKKVMHPSEGLGIVLGNEGAKHKIIKVCNPYCGPCAKAHPIMEEILQNNPDIQLQIIFSATGEEKDILTPPVRHLLAVAEKGDETVTKAALHDWYAAPKKDYKIFSEKYRTNESLQAQSEKVKQMRTWCDKTEISFTPTFFVNGHQLPEMYTAEDLKYFLSL